MSSSNKKIKNNKTKSKNIESPPTSSYLDESFKKLSCSPKQEKDFTCYTTNAIIRLRDSWNARHPDALINSNDVKVIWESLKSALGNVCNKESCWFRQLLKEGTSATKDLFNYFAPESPKTWNKNPNEWLSSIDITKVMKQYEDAFPFFEFIGPSPIDFDKTPKGQSSCVYEELCNFNIKSYLNPNNNKHKIGIIFNTDPHYLSGSHWISLFINLKKHFIFFFDSTGESPSKEINKFVKRIMQQGKEVGINFKYIINNKQHQKSNTECGIYSLFMIANLLKETKTPNDFLTTIFTDKEMMEFRKIFFNKESV
jgi:hypothetical protein